MRNALQKTPQFVNRYPGFFQDMRESRTLDWFVGWNSQSDYAIASELFQSNMAAFLTDNFKPGSFECTNQFVIIERGNLAHKTISLTIGVRPVGRLRSSVSSRYNSIASRILANASVSVSPSLMQPGKAGTCTVKPPSSDGSRTTFSFIISLLSKITIPLIRFLINFRLNSYVNSTRFVKSAKTISSKTLSKIVQACVIWRFGIGERRVQNVLHDKNTQQLQEVVLCPIQ